MDAGTTPRGTNEPNRNRDVTAPSARSVPRMSSAAPSFGRDVDRCQALFTEEAF